ncbi:translation initiation factor IF-6 [Thermogladius sp. 4427co]|uniref:translation initiation factor IF-6 n=1 Tax=Thermogladius sp. 4427co TaxID=3450718 RepID=UPI003F799437
MEIVKLSVYGNSNIGVYIFANNKIALVPPGLPRDDLNTISEVLGVEVIEFRVSGSPLNGVFIAGNDNGILVPYIILDSEFELLKKEVSKHGLELTILKSNITAFGNAILVNNKAGIVSPDFTDTELREVSETLGVEVFRKSLMNLPIPGSLSVVNDSGGVVHPDITDGEIEELKKLLKVVIVERATVNAGVPFIKSGLIANNKGIIVGGVTTGPEILRIRRGFGGGNV